MVAHIYNPNTWEAGERGMTQVQGQCDLYSKFQVILGYTEKHIKQTDFSGRKKEEENAPKSYQN